MALSLSVVIPSHNRPDLLRACLATVTRHAPTGTDILVVDDASPDGAATTVTRQFAGTRVVLPTGRGFCAAANAGVRAARGLIVQLLNDDTEVIAGWAAAAMRPFQDPSVAAVAPLVLSWPGAGPREPRIDSAGDRYYVGGVAGKRGHGDVLRPEYLSPRQIFGSSASSAFYRRDVLLRIGGFPEGFGAYFEDVDVAFRLHRAGYKVIYEPAARVLHRGAASHGRAGRRLLEQQSRNEERVFWRNLPGPVLCRALPRHLAVLAGKAWLRWQEGTLAPFLCGRLRLLAEVGDIMRHRRRLRQVGPCPRLADWRIDVLPWG